MKLQGCAAYVAVAIVAFTVAAEGRLRGGRRLDCIDSDWYLHSGCTWMRNDVDDELGMRPHPVPVVRSWDEDELGMRILHPVQKWWEQSRDEDDNLGSPVSASCYFAQQRLCGKCGTESECRLQCIRENEKTLRKACGF